MIFTNMNPYVPIFDPGFAQPDPAVTFAENVAIEFPFISKEEAIKFYNDKLKNQSQEIKSIRLLAWFVKKMVANDHSPPSEIPPTVKAPHNQSATDFSNKSCKSCGVADRFVRQNGKIICGYCGSLVKL